AALAPATRRDELGRALELAIERDRLGPRAELAEHHAGEQQRIARRWRGGLGGEHDIVAGLAQELPRYGDLGDVEIAIRKRYQHAGHAPQCMRGSVAPGPNRTSCVSARGLTRIWFRFQRRALIAPVERSAGFDIVVVCAGGRGRAACVMANCRSL